MHTFHKIIILLLVNITLQQCNHPIFCSESILKAVANSEIFSDSKSFVDLILKVPVETALSNFLSYNISEFVRLSFAEDPEIILQSVTPEDYKDNLSLLDKLQDINLRNFTLEVHRRWKNLAKKVVLSNSKNVGNCTKQCSSFIEEMDNRIILVPGGRFRESYYWDTYWIILGLITSEMYSTAQLILDSFALMIKTYGFIPNGFRQYYLNRSQPPFYFLMVKKLAEALSKNGEKQRSNNLQMKHFPMILKQHEYWEQTHSTSVDINQKKFKVNQYRANTFSPRPQSYRQDIKTVQNLPQNQKKRVLNCLSSMAESGWDFSSRWFEKNQLDSTIIDYIIPTDLNVLLGLQQSYLALLCGKFGREDLISSLVNRINERKSYFTSIKKQQRYPDYRYDQPMLIKSVYPTDYFPYLLFSETANVSKNFKKLINPSSSFINTGQQWDAPNVWAPNSWIINQVASYEQAVSIGIQWIKTTYCGWKKTGNLYEKYHSDILGERGQGGQYVVQVGFGWTNGLALHYINLYGQFYNLGDC